MNSLSTIAANCCFTAAVIAAREARYDACVVFVLLFVANVVVSCLNELKFVKADKARHIFTIKLGEAVCTLAKEKSNKEKVDDEMQSCESKADTIGD